MDELECYFCIDNIGTIEFAKRADITLKCCSECYIKWTVDTDSKWVKDGGMHNE